MNHVLEFDSIRLSFNDKVILSDIYIKCETGKITGLLGRNSQGKSCLFNIIYGKQPDLMLFLPQFDFIPKHLTVGQVFKDFSLDYLAFEKRFPDFNSKHNCKLRNLSGGQFRFIQTYSIIKAKSQFSILDEPFTHLMPLQIEKIVELLLEEKANKGFLITDHLYRQIINISDDLYLLANGKTHMVKNMSDVEDLGYV